MSSWIENMHTVLKNKNIEIKPECKINAYPLSICMAHAHMEVFMITINITLSSINNAFLYFKQKCPDFDDSNEKCIKIKEFINNTYEKFVSGKTDDN